MAPSSGTEATVPKSLPGDREGRCPGERQGLGGGQPGLLAGGGGPAALVKGLPGGVGNKPTLQRRGQALPPCARVLPADRQTWAQTASLLTRRGLPFQLQANGLAFLHPGAPRPTQSDGPYRKGWAWGPAPSLSSATTWVPPPDPVGAAGGQPRPDRCGAEALERENSLDGTRQVVTKQGTVGGGGGPTGSRCRGGRQLRRGADLSLVTVGFSWMLAKGFLRRKQKAVSVVLATGAVRPAHGCRWCPPGPQAQHGGQRRLLGTAGEGRRLRGPPRLHVCSEAGSLGPEAAPNSPLHISGLPTRASARHLPRAAAVRLQGHGCQHTHTHRPLSRAHKPGPCSPGPRRWPGAHRGLGPPHADTTDTRHRRAGSTRLAGVDAAPGGGPTGSRRGALSALHAAVDDRKTCQTRG